MRYSSFCLKYEDQFKKNTRRRKRKNFTIVRSGYRALTPSAFRIHDRGGCTRAMYIIDQENKYKMHCAAMNFSETHVAVGSDWCSSAKRENFNHGHFFIQHITRVKKYQRSTHSLTSNTGKSRSNSIDAQTRML